MRLTSALFQTTLVLSAATLGISPAAHSESLTSDAAFVASTEMPDAPVPQNAPAENASPPSNTESSTQGSSSAQPEQKSQRETAAEQLKAEEKQRVLGIVPSFGTSYVSDAASLSAGQKMQLAIRSAVDPFTFAVAFLVAGLHEGLDKTRDLAGARRVTSNARALLTSTPLMAA